MSVHFALRSHYEGPGGKHVRRFGDTTVLDWFRNRWAAVAEAENPSDWVERELGCRAHGGFDSLFWAIAEHNLPAPTTAEQLRRYLAEHMSVEGDVLFTPHTAFYSVEGYTELRTKTAEEVRRLLLGEPPRNPVNAVNRGT